MSQRCIDYGKVNPRNTSAVAQLQTVLEKEQELEKAQEIVITRYGKPLVRLIPVSQTREKFSHAKLRALQPIHQIASEALIRTNRDER